MKLDNISARNAILKSIRDHLASSSPYDAVHAQIKGSQANLGEGLPRLPGIGVGTNDGQPGLTQLFSENLAAVGGHCVVVPSETEAASAVNRIICDLQKTMRIRRIAISNSPIVERIASSLEIQVDEVTINPNSADIFDYDVGISGAQYAVAETGTLVLESDVEKHRLVSLVPPVHVAVIEANSICRTIEEALAKVNGIQSSPRDSDFNERRRELSRTVTMITGPSRTADIELTLTIGVHGPQEVYVVVLDQGSP